MMTLTEFYSVLEKKTRDTGAQWELRHGMLRTDPTEFYKLEDHCPLSFVANTEPLTVAESARVLELNPMCAVAGALASDGSPAADVHVRLKLFHACGLEG